ncbi:phosphohydrolase [Kitasatospora sp. MBT63]|uniref:phosphohydrolase n=1 Tax=Kitasatospora sp. MBT63 TaxID=1444768 RepID=UPI001E3FCE75|nr:phosphohydrolase [Kitasatospora sp. MBT63]
MSVPVPASLPVPVPVLDLAGVERLAAEAHAGQTDKIGVPYVEHVRAVAAGVAAFGTGLQMAALLHDVLEDTPLTAEDLLRAGVPFGVVATVRRVSRTAGVAYHAMLQQIVTDHSATLLKISDNAHNSRADRAAGLPAADRERLAERYRAARRVLWPAVAPEDVRTVVSTVNPDLLAELDGRA